jgi:hypothetical protein
MEALTRMVADSLARHGFDRPVDPRRLQWSRWFRCDSPHSLLVVPSKPGIFAIAEEVMDLGPTTAHVGTAPQTCPERAQRAEWGCPTTDLTTPDPKRMLAVLQFSEDDDMAFTLDRMFTKPNPMRARFAAGQCFLRFVVIEDQSQRRSICAALNQWMISSAEKASGIPAGFSSSGEPDRVGRTLMSDKAGTMKSSAHAMSSTESTFAQVVSEVPLPNLDSGANKNIHCPHPLPSGF